MTTPHWKQCVVAGAEPREKRALARALCRGGAPVAPSPGHRWPAVSFDDCPSSAASFCPSHHEEAVAE